MVGEVQGAVSRGIGVVGAISGAALALLGVAEANADGPPPAAGAGAILKAAQIGGVAVLTNAQGLTLYWFAPDTPTTSRCTGSCAAYWPPVGGASRVGSGVTGKLGTIRRPGGGLQATYSRHPLHPYTPASPPRHP